MVIEQGKTVRFIASVSDASCVHLWTIDDGSAVMFGSEVRHRFGRSGSYTVTHVSVANGESAQSRKTVIVSPFASFLCKGRACDTTRTTICDISDYDCR